MKLSRLIENIKSAPKRKLKEEEELKYRQEQEEIRRVAEELEKANTPIKKCMKHGNLFLPDVIKSGINRWTGGQAYKCRHCMKDFHKKHYENNREKVLSACEKYKKENPEKYRETKNKSKRKMYEIKNYKDKI